MGEASGKTCADLFEGLECTIIGNPHEHIEGLAYRSDEVQPHDMFFCIVGLVVDGHSFAQDAIDRGAKVLVVERELYLADAMNVTEVVVADSRKAMAYASANFYDNPSTSFQLVGVTGTNGKTTTVYLVEHIARVAGKKTGLIGTVGLQIGDEHESTEHTTPEAPDLEKAFAHMRDARCEVVAMEVSSHALDLARVWRADFAVTAFTNLTQDHLDYHSTFGSYFESKSRLFSVDYPARRVISINDRWGQKLYERCVANGDEIITVGYDAAAHIHPLSVGYAATHTALALDVRGERYDLNYPLVGRFNVENVMCAFGIGLQLGIAADVIVEALADVPKVPGRLERVSAADVLQDGDVALDGADDHVQRASDTVSVYVDYAHTPDALTKAIDAVKALTDHRTLVVFGCGGNRDAGKRPLMGQAALAADYAIVTSDNPRHEQPEAIIDDVVAGMDEGQGRFEVIVDRRQAIGRAVSLAEPGDSVLVAGKGHEDYQLVGDEVLSFDDRLVAAEALAQRNCSAEGMPSPVDGDSPEACGCKGDGAAVAVDAEAGHGRGGDN